MKDKNLLSTQDILHEQLVAPFEEACGYIVPHMKKGDLSREHFRSLINFARRDDTSKFSLCLNICLHAHSYFAQKKFALNFIAEIIKGGYESHDEEVGELVEFCLTFLKEDQDSYEGLSKIIAALESQQNNLLHDAAMLVDKKLREFGINPVVSPDQLS